MKSPIKFDKEDFTLAWSHNEKGSYYKQEYLRKNETLNKFLKMITVDLLITNVNIKSVVSDKLNEIKARKKNDPVVNYQLVENPSKDEFILDFVINQGEIYEWNLYRYKSIITNKGKGVLLFAFTYRRNNDQKIEHFFTFLKKK